MSTDEIARLDLGQARVFLVEVADLLGAPVDALDLERMLERVGVELVARVRDLRGAVDRDLRALAGDRLDDGRAAASWWPASGRSARRARSSS